MRVLSLTLAAALTLATGSAQAASFITNSFVVSGGVIDNATSDFFGLINGSTALSLRSALGGGTTFLDTFNTGNFGATGVLDNAGGSLSYTSLSSDVPLRGPAPRHARGAPSGRVQMNSDTAQSVTA